LRDWSSDVCSSDCQHHVTAAGKFDSKTLLRLAGIDIGMDCEKAGWGCLWRSVLGHVDEGAHGVGLWAFVAAVLDLDAAGGLGEMSQHAAGQDQNHSPSRQGPSAAHVSLPVPTAFDSAFGLVLFVIDTVSEGRLRASVSAAKHAFEVWTQNQDRPLSRL